MSERTLFRAGGRSSFYEVVPTVNIPHNDPITQPHGVYPSNKMRSTLDRGGVVADWFHNLFAVIMALSTLGTSVTFSYVVSGIRGPKGEPKFSTEVYEGFMAISWLLFILDLAIATLFSTILSFYRDQAVVNWRAQDKTKRLIIQWIATLSVALLYTLTISAFIFLALVITAYAAGIGWVALAFAVICGVGGLGGIVWQSPAFQTRPGYEQFNTASS